MEWDAKEMEFEVEKVMINEKWAKVKTLTSEEKQLQQQLQQTETQDSNPEQYHKMK